MRKQGYVDFGTSTEVKFNKAQEDEIVAMLDTKKGLDDLMTKFNGMASHQVKLENMINNLSEDASSGYGRVRDRIDSAAQLLLHKITFVYLLIVLVFLLQAFMFYFLNR